MTTSQKRAIRRAIRALESERRKLAPQANLSRVYAAPGFEQDAAAYAQIDRDIRELKELVK